MMEGRAFPSYTCQYDGKKKCNVEKCFSIFEQRPRDHVQELQWKKMLLGDCIFPRESSLVPPQRRRQTKRNVIHSGLQSQELPN